MSRAQKGRNGGIPDSYRRQTDTFTDGGREGGREGGWERERQRETEREIEKQKERERETDSQTRPWINTNGPPIQQRKVPSYTLYLPTIDLPRRRT